MGWPIAAAIFASAGIGAWSSSKASKAQSRAARRAMDVEWKMFEQRREDMMPWLEAGQEAVPRLRDIIRAGPGEYRESPGFRLRLEEGLKGIERAASAGGYLGTPAHMAAAGRYGGEARGSDFDRFLARYYASLTPWQSLAGMGQTAGMGLGQLGATTGRSLAETYLQGGAAQAAGYAGMSGAFRGGVQDIGGYLQTERFIDILGRNQGIPITGRAPFPSTTGPAPFPSTGATAAPGPWWP